jgi:predicted permease
MLADLRFALRSLAKSPGFTIVAVATLAIAIGVNTAIFSLVNTLMLRPIIPYKPSEVVNIFTARKEANRDYRAFSYSEFTALRETNPVFRDVAALAFTLTAVGHDDAMKRYAAFFVSQNFFSLAGVQPVRGRFFTREESLPNANTPVVVVGYSFWQHMGGRPDFVGSTIQLGGKPFTVIGIAPRGFSGVSALLVPDIWFPLGVYSQFSNPLANNTQANDLAQPTNYALSLIGRLNPGLTLKLATTLLPTITRRLDALQPPEAATVGARELQIFRPSRFSISTEPQDDGRVTSLAALVLGMAAIVLLIACLNLANMLLARSASRAKEIAIRLSLGASRWRVVRQLLVEGLTLALCGGMLGLFLGQWSNDLLTGSLNSRAVHFAFAIELQPDATVLGATFAFCVLATLIFSLGPALKSVRVDLVNDLKQQVGEPAVSGHWNQFFSPRHCLVMAQISLSLVLLFSGGLFFRGALNASGLALGFEPNGCAVAELDYSLTRSPEATVRQKMPEILNRIQAMPGVRSAAFATLLPYSGTVNTRRVAPAESAPTTGTNAQQPGFNGVFSAITADLFDTIGVRLLQGRKFTTVEAEKPKAPSVVIVDTRMAALLFPNGNALGQRIRYTSPPTGAPAEMEIVGIVYNHRQRPRAGDTEPHLYVPLAQSYNPNTFVTVRFAIDNAKTVAADIAELRKTLRAFDLDLPIIRFTPYTDFIDTNINLWIYKLGAVMFGAFGGIALLLAVVGVYGVKAYSVARRTREIGIRMALGAMPKNVFALIMKQGALQIAFAVCTGIILSLLVGKALSSRLFGVSPGDPLVLCASSAILAASALLACYLPARRATKISPIEALRTE